MYLLVLEKTDERRKVKTNSMYGENKNVLMISGDLITFNGFNKLSKGCISFLANNEIVIYIGREAKAANQISFTINEDRTIKNLLLAEEIYEHTGKKEISFWFIESSNSYLISR